MSGPFLKVMSVKYDIAGFPADTVNHLSRTYLDSVEFLSQVSVALNGQQLPLHAAETVSTFAKYYWEGTIVPDTSITIDIYGNSTYTPPGYTADIDLGTPGTQLLTLDCTISTDDIIFIEYTHT